MQWAIYGMSDLIGGITELPKHSLDIPAQASQQGSDDMTL